MTFLLEDEYHKTFSQIAKESGFRFNLYRGRIDWKKLEVLDVDRIVRDLDMEMLNIHINNVIGCNLDTEYDVKILDPNFVKLFRIAQLTIDFLLHCKRYLERQLKDTSVELNTSRQETEGLRKHLHLKKIEIKQLKKKLKQRIEKDKASQLVSPGHTSSSVQCNMCNKLFVNDTYLRAHQARRHTGQHQDHTIVLQQEIKLLKDRLQAAEIKLCKENCEQVEKEVQVAENTQDNVGKKYQDEIKQMKEMFFSEMQKLKQNAVKTELNEIHQQTVLAQVVEEQRNRLTEISYDKQDEDTNQETRSESYWEGKLEARESVWRTRLSALDQEHKKEIRELQEKLKTSYDKGLYLKNGFEKQLQEVVLKAEEEKEQNVKVVDQETVVKKEIRPFVKSPTLQKKTEIVRKEISFDNESTPSVPQPRPIVKRKAFVYQKTFQEETDSPQEATLGGSGDVRNAVKEFEVRNNKINGSGNLGKEIENKIITLLNNKSNNTTVENKPKVDFESRKRVDGVGESVAQEVHSNTSEEVTEDSESESGTIQEESENSESDSQEGMVTVQKQLALQSLQSMEDILASNPEILQELKTDLIQLMDRRLQDLGVDSEWAGVPSKTFKTKMAVLKHHQKITAKRHTGYFTLRDHLLQSLEEHYVSKPNESKPTPKQNIMMRLRNRAAQVLSMARPSLGLAKKGNTKLPATLVEVKASNPTGDVIEKSKAESDVPPLPAKRGVVQSMSLVKDKDAVESDDLSDPLQEVMSHSHNTLLRSAMDPTLTRTRSEFLLSSSSENEEIKSPLGVDQPVRIYKSALRSASSTGNLSKKRVVFLDDLFSGNKKSFSDDMMNITPPEACATPRNSATSIDRIQLTDEPNLKTTISASLDFIAVVHSTPRSYTLQLPKAPSPASSLTSIGSSLLDISPTEDPKSKNTLEWNLEDIEDNLKSD